MEENNNPPLTFMKHTSRNYGDKVKMTNNKSDRHTQIQRTQTNNHPHRLHKPNFVDYHAQLLINYNNNNIPSNSSTPLLAHSKIMPHKIQTSWQPHLKDIISFLSVDPGVNRNRIQYEISYDDQ